MEDLLFECIWGQEAATAREDAKALWRTYGALENEAHMTRRAQELVYIVRDNEGKAGAVSTARPVRVAFLNNNFFYEFRCFIPPPFSRPGLDSLLALKTKAFLEAQEGSGSRFKGMIMIIENDELKKQRTKAVWPATGMVFAGYSAKGHHIRVGYFKGVRI